MKLEKLEATPSWDWPTDAGKTLLAVLKNQQASEDHRVLAAELAGDTLVLDDALAEALLAILRDSSASNELRCTAAIATGPVLELVDIDGFDDTDALISEDEFQIIQTTLRELYQNEDVPTEVRRRALEASIRAPRDWHNEAIVAAYNSDDRGWQLTAVFAMRWVRGFDTEIVAALDHDDEEIAYEAVCAAGNWGVEGAWHHVEALLDEDTDKQLLLVAIEAAATIRPSTAGELLVDLTDSADEEIAAAAEEALTMARMQNGDDADDGFDAYDNVEAFGDEDDFDTGYDDDEM